MKKALNFLTVILATVFLSQCSGGDYAQGVSADMEAQLALLPDNTNGLAYINLDKMRESVFYEMALDSMEDRINDDEEFQELVDATGFDLRKDVNEVFVVFDPNAKKRDASVLAMVNGKFDEDRIMEFVQKKDEDQKVRSENYGEFTLYSGDNTDKVLCFASETQAVAGNETLVKTWLDNFKAGKSNVNNDLLARLETIKYKNGAWFTIDAQNIVDEMMDGIDDANFKQFGALRKVKNVQFSVDVNDAIKLDGEGNFSDAQNAELFHDAAKGALATLKLSVNHDRDAVDVMNKVNIYTSDSSVKVNFEMTKADVEKLMQRSRGLAMR